MFTESYEDDISANDKASKIHEEVVNFFKSIPLDKIDDYKITLNNGLYHSFTIHTSSIGKLVVAFGKRNDTISGGYGTNGKGIPFIVLFLLDDKWNVNEIDKLNKPKWRSIFIHEATHLIDNKRHKPTYNNKNAGKEFSSLSKISYYNSPEEMNTFFQELITEVRNIDDYAKEQLLKIYDTPKKLTDYFYDSGFWDKDQFLTTQNRNRIKKRIFRLVSNFFKVDK